MPGMASSGSIPEDRGDKVTAGQLTPDRAQEVAEELFRAMLPKTEADFRRELERWHPELDANYYLLTERYPRCWIVMAAGIVAAEFTEYARALLESLREDPNVIRELDSSIAGSVGPPLVSELNGAPSQWRSSLCDVGRPLWFFSPQTLTRAFGVGLNFAFVHPQGAAALVDIIRASIPVDYERMVTAAATIVATRPLSSSIAFEP